MIDRFLNDDSIIALCSGSGRAGVSLIRLSCSDFSRYDFDQLFGKVFSDLTPRRFYHLQIHNQGKLVDSIGLVKFLGPNSFTGEDTLELYVHGNPIIVNSVLELFKDLFDFRIALPGEFSFRAFRNGKINFSELQGLELILNGDSEYAVQHGHDLLSGKDTELFKELHFYLLKLFSSFEIMVDFSDDIGEEAARREQIKCFNSLDPIIEQLKQKIQFGNKGLLHPKIVLFGAPNAGKSTLFNFLLNSNRAIVSDTEGTTRDFITEQFIVHGNTFRLVDTAGIRNNSDDHIESQGIDSAKDLVENAFIRILVVNPALGKHEYDESIVPDIVIFTHMDRYKAGPIEPLLKMFPNVSKDRVFFKYGQQFEDSHRFLDEINNKWDNVVGQDPLLIKRQIDLVGNIVDSYETFKLLNTSCNDLGILLDHLNSLKSWSGQLLGEHNADQILDNIFSSFCIGK
jgi:tRNA modification GTPase